jgi:hemolysin D
MMRWELFKLGFERYRETIKLAWKERREFDTPSLKAHEREFLPAQLELRDSPPSPAPLWSMRLVVLFAAIALVWAIFGKVEIVVQAGGKVIPTGYTKTIQPLETSVVKAIAVRNGDVVRKGDLLIELDSTAPAADVAKTGEQLASARLAAVRSESLLRAMTSNQPIKLNVTFDAPAALLAAETNLARGQIAEYRAKLTTLQAELQQRNAELFSTQQVVLRLQAAVPIAQERAQNFKEMLAEQFVSRHAYLEKEQDRLDKEGELAAQTSRLKELEAAISRQKSQIESHEAEFRRTALDIGNSASQQITQLRQEAVKMQLRDRQYRLLAPVDGVVQQLSVHTIGGVVQSAQPLLVVVPQAGQIEVEVTIENKDIGFISPGQRAVTKVDAFSYTKYGTLEGVVSMVSHDAIQDEKRGLIYQAHILLGSKELAMPDGKKISVTPGMTVVVDIQTGKRRIIEYFLSPLVEYTSTSLRER